MPIEKANIKKPNNVVMLRELPFYEELNIVKTVEALKNYAKSYNIEITKDNDQKLNGPLAHWEASKPVIKDLFRDLLIEMKGFKYQVYFSKQKGNGDAEFTAAYFNSTAKTVISINKHGLHKSFQELLCRLDNWINEGSVWTIEYIEWEYICIYICKSLLRGVYIELPDELPNPMKGLIKIKNNDKKCFLWCNIKYLNPLNKNPQGIK